jgi:cobalt/nickel transport system permease protein
MHNQTDHCLRPQARKSTLNPPTTAVITLLALVANLAAANPAVPCLIAVIAVMWALSTGVSYRTLLLRLSVPWYLATVAAITQVFLTGTTPVFYVGPLVATAEGIARGMLLASQMLAGGSLVLAFGLTVPLTGLLDMACRWRVPPVVVEIAMFTYRFLFLLADEAARIRQAQTVRLGWSGWRLSLACAGQLAGMVVVKAYDRSEKVYQAMVVRGYTGAILTTPDATPLQWWWVTGAALLLSIAVWLARIHPW